MDHALKTFTLSAGDEKHFSSFTLQLGEPGCRVRTTVYFTDYP